MADFPLSPDATPTDNGRPPTVDGRARTMETDEERERRFRLMLQRQAEGHEQRHLGDILLERLKRYRNLDREARDIALKEKRKMFRYFEGDQNSDWNERGEWESLAQEGDFAYSVNVLAGHVETAFSQIMRTELAYEIAAIARDDATMMRFAHMCEQIAIPELTRLFTQPKRQREAYNTILAGESYRYLWWGADPEHPNTVERLKYKSETTTLPPTRECAACHTPVPEGAETCPDCRATYILETPGSTRTVNVPETDEAGNEVMEQVTLGENHLHIPHPMSIQRELSAYELKDSRFIIERDSLPMDAARWLYKTWFESPATGGMSEETSAIRSLERAGNQIDANTGSSRSYTADSIGASKTPLERARYFLDATEYGDITIPQDTVLPNGQQLEAGRLLGELYPVGAFVLIVGDQIIEFESCLKSRRWSEVVWGLRPSAAGGRGFKVLIQLQDLTNDDVNLDTVIRNTHGRPFTAVMREYVRVLPEAGQFLFVDRLPPNASSMDAVVKQFPGQASAGLIGANTEMIQSAMQFIVGTNTVGSVQTGAPDARSSGTATGVRAMVQQAADRQIGPVGMRIAADFELIYQILENWRDYAAAEQKEDIAKRFGPDMAALFFKCNFRKTILPTVVEGSDMPRSLALTQENIVAFANAAAALQKSPYAQEILSRLADILGIEASIGPGRGDRREAEYRLNRLRSLEEELKQSEPAYLTDVGGAAHVILLKLVRECVPDGKDEDATWTAFFDPIRLDHATFMDVYADWLLGEEAKSATDVRKACVIELWNQHLRAGMKGELMQAGIQREVQAEMQGPQPDPNAGQPTPEQQAQLEAQARGQEQDAQAQGEERKAALTEQAANADAVRQEQAAVAEHERSKDMKLHDKALEIATAQRMPQAEGETRA